MSRLLARAKQKCLLVAASGEDDGDDLAWCDFVVSRFGHTNLRMLQELLQLSDSCLILSLLLARSVVATVLLEVTLLASQLNALGDLHAGRPSAFCQLSCQAVVGLLGQPSHGVVSHSGQG